MAALDPLPRRAWVDRRLLLEEVGAFGVVGGVCSVMTLLVGLAVVGLARYPLGQEGALVLQVADAGSIALGTVIRYVSYRRWVFPAAVAA